VIVATAGHVDHGKTSLVRALTQVDTDRLDEEKRRGMSIDIGFAYADFGHEAPLGFVDVPGHERFVRNMLAGVACIDLALLVIAADDGPMPQTLEHLAILTLLGVSRCTVVLTKIDRVVAARLAQVHLEIAALLARGPFAVAPVFPVVATTGIGVPALRQHLGDLSAMFSPRRAAGHFRLAVDRSFSLKGAGRIVTGAVLSGSVKVGDKVIVSPRGAEARVRAIHAQNLAADSAHAGQRCALNLVGVGLKDAEPVRGDWVVAPEAHAPTDRLDVRIEVPLSADVPRLHRTAMVVHIGAAAVNASVVLLDGPALADGSGHLAQLVLDQPIAALVGDRFILRDAAANRTVAGGGVIDPFGPMRGRSKLARVAQLAALSEYVDASQTSAACALARLLDDAPTGIDLDRFALARNLTVSDTSQLCAEPDIKVMAFNSRQWAVSTMHWNTLCQRLLAAIALWHEVEPDSVGPSDAALAEGLGLRPAPELLLAALATLVASGSVVREGLRCRVAGHRPVLNATDNALLQRITTVLHPAGLRPPIIGELVLLVGVLQPALLEFLQRANRLGMLVQVAPNRFYLPKTVLELAAHARQLSDASPDGGFNAAAYRDRTGIGRNLTVQVLEFLDRTGVTHFDGTLRRLNPPLRSVSHVPFGVTSRFRGNAETQGFKPRPWAR